MPRFDELLRDLPAGLTEADVIDMVDGAVPPGREPVVIAALRAQPRLGLLVKQLRVDRAAFEEVMGGPEAAPAGLIDAIQMRLDREALTALVHEAEEATAPIPIGAAPRGGGGRGVIRVLAESVWARRLATAASIAIVGGLGVIGAREVMRKWPKLPGTVPVATNTDRGTGEASPSAGDHASTALAMNDAGVEGPGPDAAAAALAANDTAPAADTPVVEDRPLTAAEAVRLAQEGRLVITVRSSQLPGTLKHLEGLARAGAADARWRSHDLDKLPAELAMLATPLPDPGLDVRPPMSPTFVGPTLPTFASVDDGAPGPRVKAGAEVGGSPLGEWNPRVQVRALRLVRMDADARALDDLLRDLNIGKDQAASFRALPAPLEQRAPLDAESVLWWAAGPESWTQKIVLPVIVETVE